MSFCDEIPEENLSLLSGMTETGLIAFSRSLDWEKFLKLFLENISLDSCMDFLTGLPYAIPDRKKDNISLLSINPTIV